MAKSKKVPKKCLNENSQLFVVSKNEVKEIQRLAVSSIDSVLLLPASFAAASATIAITRLCIDSYRFFMFFNLHISIRKEKKKPMAVHHRIIKWQQPRMMLHFFTLSWACNPG